MTVAQDQKEWSMAALLRAEYPRLVRLCRSLVHDQGVAEELAQETLVEAWRHADKLHDPVGHRAWFSAIARHVCRRWLRQRGRALQRFVPWEPPGVGSWEWDEPVVAGDPLDDLLEREELVALLNHALALLPPETRALLVTRYLSGHSYAQTADAMSLSENAVAVRLHRGKAALRRVLESHFPEELAAYGLLPPPGDDLWQETRIWCPFCGRRKVIARVCHDEDDAGFRCPACCTGRVQPIASMRGMGILDNVKSYKAILSRQLTWLHHFYREALTQSRLPCPGCGNPHMGVARRIAMQNLLAPNDYGIQITCASCGWQDNTPLAYLVLDLPETQRFWRAHPKMQLRAEREVEHGGRHAVVTTYASTTSAAYLDVLSAADTLEVLAIHGTPSDLPAARRL